MLVSPPPQATPDVGAAAVIAEAPDPPGSRATPSLSSIPGSAAAAALLLFSAEAADTGCGELLPPAGAGGGGGGGGGKPASPQALRPGAGDGLRLLKDAGLLQGVASA